MSASYATHMLDGLDFLYRKTEDGLKTLHEVLGFFRKMAAMEKKFGSELQGMSRRYSVSKLLNEELGTIRAGWGSIQQELDNIGSKHHSLSESITKTLVDALSVYIKKKEADQKKLVKDGVKISREMKSSLSDLASAKSKFFSACKSADSAAGTCSKAKAEGTLKPKEINKLSQKATKSADLANVAEKEYQKQLEKTNQKQHHYYETDLPCLLKLFQEWEEERASFLKQHFERYSNFYCGFPPFLELSSNAVKKNCEEIDVAKDTQTFLEKNRTGISKPPDIQYEAYTPQNPEFVVSNSSSLSTTYSSTPSNTLSVPLAPRSSFSTPAPPSPSFSDSRGGGGEGNIVETNIPVSKEIEVNENEYGLTDADAALPAEFQQTKLKKQLKELKDNIRAERKTAKGIEKLTKFYASDPVAQEKTQQELNQRKEKIAKMKEIQSSLEAELAQFESDCAAPSEPQQEYEQADTTPRGGDWEAGEIVEEQQEMVVLATAKGLFEYVASNDTELSFEEGEIMNITDQNDTGWWFAEIGDRSGFVPKNYLEVVEQF